MNTEQNFKNSTESNDEDHTLLCGVFSTNDWIKEDFKGFSFQRANNGKSKNEFFVMLNPYEPITECGMLPKNLKKGIQIKDKDGVILKVVDFGSAGLFGEGTWSWVWIGFSSINCFFQDVTQ